LTWNFVHTPVWSDCWLDHQGFRTENFIRLKKIFLTNCEEFLYLSQINYLLWINLDRKLHVVVTGMHRGLGLGSKAGQLYSSGYHFISHYDDKNVDMIEPLVSTFCVFNFGPLVAKPRIRSDQNFICEVIWPRSTSTYVQSFRSIALEFTKCALPYCKAHCHCAGVKGRIVTAMAH
jgi:hypothetical protein